MIDRRNLMKNAHRIHKQSKINGCEQPFSECLRAAWAQAKSAAALSARRYPKQQQAGIRAALKRYGIDAEALAARAKEAVRAIVAAIDTQRPALLPPPGVKALEITRGEDGVYRI